MIDYLRSLFNRYLSDPQAIILALLLIVGFTIVWLVGDVLAPVLASLVVAYILDGGVERLHVWRIPRIIALNTVFIVFLAILFLVLFKLVPLLSQQATQLFKELPNMMAHGQQLLMQLPERYPNFISESQVQDLIATIKTELASLGQNVVSYSLASVIGLITIMVYLVLVPLLSYFFLKDKRKILRWAAGFLPDNRALADKVWYEVNQKIARYVRGKLLQVLIIWSVSYITFKLLGLEFAMLLSFMVGLSVIIPYVGAAVVTVPIAFIAFLQWGADSQFVYVMIAYAVIQFIDGNILVPLLFSEMVNLHPVAIIIAVLVFGSIWGIWGVFFAIPLATLVNAVIKAWPKARSNSELRKVVNSS